MNDKLITKEIANIRQEPGYLYERFVGDVIPSYDLTLKEELGGKLASYRRCLYDDQVMVGYQQRCRALTSRPLIVLPGAADIQSINAAFALESDLQNLGFDLPTEQMLKNALHFGASIAELMYEIKPALVKPAVYDDSGSLISSPVFQERVVFSNIVVKAREMFVFGKNKELRMLTEEEPISGVELPRSKFWVLTFGGVDDNPNGIGLASTLYWLVWFKRNVLKFWSIFLDKFGNPTVVGEYPHGIEQQEQSRLLNAISRVSSDSGIIIPEGMKIYMLEASRTGSASYNEFVNMINTQIALVIMGQTMTSTDGASFAQAKIHFKMFTSDIVGGDGDLIGESFSSTAAKWWLYHNRFVFPGASPPIIKRGIQDIEDLKTKAEIDLILSKMGWNLTTEEVKKRYGEGYVYGQKEQSQNQEGRDRD